MENLPKIKEYIREFQGIYPKEKIESDLIDNFGAISKSELDSIYDDVIESKKKTDSGNRFFFFMIFILIFGIPFVPFLFGFILVALYILYLAHSAKSIDKDNKSAKNLLIGTYTILVFFVIAYLLIYLLY